MPAEKLSDSRDLEFAIDKLVGGKGQNNLIGGLKKSKILSIFDLDFDCKSFNKDCGIEALGLDCQSKSIHLAIENSLSDWETDKIT